MARAVQATPRTLTAIRTADNLARNLVPPKRIRSSVGAGASGAYTVIKIKSKVDYETYIADVYGNGKHNAATEADVTIKILEIASTETMPNNRYFFARYYTWDNGGEDAEYLTIEIARSY